MKERRFSFLSGMLTMALICGLTVSAMAASGAFTITVDPVNIQVNGQTFQPQDAKGNTVPVFAYNGTTYAPLRALAEAYGLTVGYDSSANMATVASQAATDTPTEPKYGVYGRKNPAPIKTSQSITVESYSSGTYTATLEVTSVFRGQSAWAAIRDKNQFNDPAPAGKEYVLASIKATVDSVSTDGSVSISKYDFTAFSDSNAEYKAASVVVPSPELTGSAYSGGTLEGFVVFLVDETDTAPKMVYGADRSGGGGVWFSLTK